MGEEDYRSLVADYVNYRLGKHGYQWENAPAQRKNNKVFQAVRKLGDEFENKQDSCDFQEMVTSLHITPDTAQSTFLTVSNEMFSNGINWGRVVALIGFGGAFSVECVSRNMPQLVDSVVDWVATYMNSNLKDWISHNGGWVSVFCLGDRPVRQRGGRNTCSWWSQLSDSDCQQQKFCMVRAT